MVTPAHLPQWRILAFLLGFSAGTIILTHLIFHDIREAIIAGLLVGILGLLFEIRIELLESTRESLDVSTKAFDRLIKHLELDRAYSESDWLVAFMEDVL